MNRNVETVIAALRPVYVRNAAGCCWHILADDGNIEQKDVDFCVDYAQRHLHPECMVVIQPMLRLSRTQRGILYAHYGDYCG